MMAQVLPLVAGFLMIAGVEASDIADRSMHQGFLSKYMASDASKTSLGDYNEFLTQRFAHPAAPAQESMALSQDFNTPKIVDAQEEKAAQKLLANDRSMSIGLSAIGVSLFTFVAMLVVRMRRGLHHATTVASNSVHESDMSIALAAPSADNSSAQENNFRSRGWLQHSSSDSRASTICYAEKPVLRLGTRKSPLAMAQAYEAQRRLGEAFPELAVEGAVEIREFSTVGDERLDISLAEIGGKGLFTRELDVALAAKEVDFCVHSTKDVPTVLIPGTELCTMLPREDTRDVIISRDKSITRFEDLPKGSIIGTASLRRQAQIYAKNPDVKCVNFRGNVQTRLKKLEAGEVECTLLAYAGLKRMSMEHHATRVLELDEMLPAISQGAISFQCNSDDEKTKKYLEALNHKPTMQAVTCERAFLATLDGNCKTPIAGRAYVADDGKLHFRGLVASCDGTRTFEAERVGSPEEAESMGRDAGMQIRKEAGEEFFEEMQKYVQSLDAANVAPGKPTGGGL
jgi:hydroxymethylbilane synthase